MIKSKKQALDADLKAVRTDFENNLTELEEIRQMFLNYKVERISLINQLDQSNKRYQELNQRILEVEELKINKSPRHVQQQSMLSHSSTINQPIQINE